MTDPSSTLRRMVWVFPDRESQRGVAIARRTEHAGAGQLHRAVAHAVDAAIAELEGA